MYTEFYDSGRTLADMLRYVADKPRVVLAEGVDPDLSYGGRQTKDAVAPREEWLLVLGASVEGPCEYLGVQLVVGEYEVGALRSNLLYAIPPRQCYRMSLPFGRPLPEHLVDKKLFILPGKFRLFGWQFHDDDWREWSSKNGAQED